MTPGSQYPQAPMQFVRIHGLKLIPGNVPRPFSMRIEKLRIAQMQRPFRAPLLQQRFRPRRPTSKKSV